MTTELLGSTIGIAARLMAGRQTAAGVVSAAVGALVEGTLWSMSMTTCTLKIVPAAFVVAGMIATGAGVFAYQEQEKKPTGSETDLRTKASGGTKAIADSPKAEQGEDLNQTIASLAQARLIAAQKAVGARLVQPGRRPGRPRRTGPAACAGGRADISDQRPTRLPPSKTTSR